MISRKKVKVPFKMTDEQRLAFERWLLHKNIVDMSTAFGNKRGSKGAQELKNIYK